MYLNGHVISQAILGVMMYMDLSLFSCQGVRLIAAYAVLSLCLHAIHGVEAYPMTPGSTQSFVGTVLDQFGDPLGDQSRVDIRWTATGGTLDNALGDTVQFTAGDTVGRFVITCSASNLIAERLVAIASERITRRIHLSHPPGYIWESDSDATITSPESGQTVLDGLDAAADHVLTPVEAGSG